MNRRNALKTGLTLAGSPLLTSPTEARQPSAGQRRDDVPTQTMLPPGNRRKLGTLAVSAVAWCAEHAPDLPDNGTLSARHDCSYPKSL